MTNQRSAPPAGDPWSARHAEGLTAHELLLQHCAHCGRIRFPAGPSCPDCWSERFEWRPHSGRGEVVSFIWYMQSMHPQFTDVPYNVAMVRLEGGPVMVSSVQGVQPGQLRVGRPVSATFADDPGGFTVLLFE